MIQLSSFMWATAIFFAIIGFLRGWNKELVSTAGILLGLFAIFQFDGFLRGTLFLQMPREQVFALEAGFFMVIVVLMYQARILAASDRRDNRNFQSSLLGILVGAVNGYLIGGSLWYFLDINEYPLPQFITAPAANSPSAAALGQMPLVLIGGGAGGTGDLLAIMVIGLLFVVLVVI